jgi:hypothetical protein
MYFVLILITIIKILLTSEQYKNKNRTKQVGDFKWLNLLKMLPRWLRSARSSSQLLYGVHLFDSMNAGKSISAFGFSAAYELE